VGDWPQQALAATSFGFVRASGPAASRKDASVVVIGAGLAGLSCVYRLHRHGIAATLYEAQEGIGGRCFSLRGFFDADQTAEHGGQYIDSRHRHIRSLAKELRIPLVDTSEQSFPAGNRQGFLNGGVESGERAAREVMNALGVPVAA